MVIYERTWGRYDEGSRCQRLVALSIRERETDEAEVPRSISSAASSWLHTSAKRNFDVYT